MSTVANKRVTRKHDARRRHVRELVWATVLAIILLLLLVECNPTVGTIGASAGSGGAEVAGSSRSFTIEGKATQPISPGVSAPLDLRLTNPNDVPMSVTDLSVRVQNISAPNADDVRPCAVGDFAVDQTSSSRKITLAARSTSTLSDLGIPRAGWPHVGMLDRSVNQDGCKGASLTLGYSASGTLAQR